MKTSCTKNEVGFELIFEDDDVCKPSDKFSIGQRSAFVRSENHDLSNIHPDLLALSAILICSPFVGSRLELSAQPSSEFIKRANGILTKYKIANSVDLSHDIEPRFESARSSPGLAFSGGVDSTAALAVMPGNTIPIFMDRPVSKGSLYNPDAAHQSCRILRELGYNSEIVECDLEYVRDPVGFPTDVANAVPAVILADCLGLNSISFGTVLESAYGTGHEHYRDYPKGSHWTFFGTLFSAANLQFSLPIGGVSEVGTSIIAYRSPVGMVAQSCIRGKWGEPCMHCWKCFRKSLLSIALRQKKYDKKEIKGLLDSNEVKGKLSAIPISHENVVAFSTSRIEESTMGKEILALKERVNELGKLGLLTKWYSPSKILIPEEWRFFCQEKILSYLKLMNAREEGVIENWDMDEFLISSETIESRERLLKVI